MEFLARTGAVLLSIVLFLAFCISASSSSTLGVLPTPLILAVVLTATLVVPRLGRRLVARAEGGSPSGAEKLQRRLVAMWIASWLMAWLAGWPGLVRHGWRLGDWFLFDELLVLTPVVVSLASLIGLPVLGGSLDATDGGKRQYWRNLVMACSLATFLVLAKELNTWEILPLPGLVSLFIAILILWIVFAYPIFFTSLIGGERVRDDRVADEVARRFQRSGLKPVALFHWDTQSQQANAILVGLVPWTRRLFITDALVQQFDHAEFMAMIEHEIGHLRHRHLPWRVAAMVMPAGLLGSLLLILQVESAWGGHWVDDTNLIEALAAALYCGIAVVLLRLVSQLGEHQADLYALHQIHCPPGSSPGAGRVELGQLPASPPIVLALRRLAELYPSLSFRSSLQYPSLLERIVFLQRVAVDDRLARRLHVQLGLLKLTLLAGGGAAWALLLLAFWKWLAV